MAHHFRIGTSRAKKALRELAACMAGKRPDPTGVAERTKRRLAEALLRLVRERYLTLSAGGSDEQGKSWAPLSPSTLKRRKEGRGALLLQDTGRLFGSLGAEATPAGAAVTSSVPYAAHVHARRPLWPARLPPAWREELLRVMAEGAREMALALLGRGA